MLVELRDLEELNAEENKNQRKSQKTDTEVPSGSAAIVEWDPFHGLQSLRATDHLVPAQGRA
jgi:hypothetical protein